jgi:hypothetical protein
MRALFVSLLLLGVTAACNGSGDPGDVDHDAPPQAAVCHFTSGRPCTADHACMGAKGDECNYYACNDGQLLGGAVGCSPGTVEPIAGGPFNCDPASIALTQPGLLTPPNGACPIGSLWALDASREIPYLQCVPLDQCVPIPCDPQWNGDGCPGDYVCDAASSTCVAP